jgi:hypothetical protein
VGGGIVAVGQKLVFSTRAGSIARRQRTRIESFKGMRVWKNESWLIIWSFRINRIIHVG